MLFAPCVPLLRALLILDLGVLIVVPPSPRAPIHIYPMNGPGSTMLYYPHLLKFMLEAQTSSLVKGLQCRALARYVPPGRSPTLQFMVVNTAMNWEGSMSMVFLRSANGCPSTACAYQRHVADISQGGAKLDPEHGKG